MPDGMRHARVVIFAALVLGRGLAAQGASESPQDSTPPPPIAVDSIPEAATATQAALARLRTRLPADTTLDRLDSTLALFLAEYAEADPASTADRLDSLYLDALLDLERAWVEFQGRQTRWRGRASELTGRVEAVRDTLVRIRGRWQATRTVHARAVPREVGVRIVTVLQAVDSVLRVVEPARGRLLAMEGTGAQLDADVASRLGEVREAQRRARRQLLRQDSPVLWKAFSALARDHRPADATVASRPDEIEAAAEYLLARTGRVQMHVALFLVAAFALWLIHRQRKSWATAEFAIHWPSDLLDHPIAASWLLALALTRVVYPGAPRGVMGLGFLLLIPALLVLLRQLLGPMLRGPTYVLLGLYTLRVLADTLSWSVPAARVALLGLAAGAAVTFVWFGRRVVPRTDDRSASGRWVRLGRRLAYLSGGLAGLAIVANVFGFVLLADLLTSGTLAAALAALGIVALVDVVVGAVLVVLFATPLGRLRVVRGNRDATTRAVRTLVHLAGIVFWLTIALRQLRLLQPARAALAAILAAPIDVGSWDFTVGSVLLFGFTLWLSMRVARGLRAILREDVLARMYADRGVPDAVASIVYYVALAVGFVFAAGAAGVEFGQLAFIAGALGVGIGFGLQAIVANFVSGLILLFERPIKTGDTLELEGLRGVVQQIGIRASTVRTFQGADVIVPNQDFVAGRVVNWTLSDQTRRVEIPIGVAYGSDPDRVIALVREVAMEHPKVLPRPAVDVLMTGFGESSLDFELRLWTSTDDWLAVRSDILVTVYRRFAEHGIEIPFPQRDLHIRSGLPAPPASPPAGS